MNNCKGNTKPVANHQIQEVNAVSSAPNAATVMTFSGQIFQFKPYHFYFNN